MAASVAVPAYSSARPVLIAVASAEVIVMAGRLVGTKVGADADNVGCLGVDVSVLRSVSLVGSVAACVVVVFMSVPVESVLESALESVLQSVSTAQKPPQVVWRIVTVARVVV